MFAKRITVFVATAAATLAMAAAAPVAASALDVTSPIRPAADGCTQTNAGSKSKFKWYDCTFFGSEYTCFEIGRTVECFGRLP